MNNYVSPTTQSFMLKHETAILAASLLQSGAIQAPYDEAKVIWNGPGISGGKDGDIIP